MTRQQKRVAQKLQIQKKEERERARNPKTPAAQVGSDAAYPDEEDEEEVNEGAMEASSDAPEEAGLSGDLEDALPTPQSAAKHVRQDTNQADMGANQSHEVNKNLRDAARTLQGEARMAHASGKKAGSLKKPSMEAKPRTVKKASTQKKLGPSNTTGKSVYDIAGSPERPRLHAPVPPTDAANFSPTRVEKKARKAQQQTQASPRRSKRVQDQQEDAAEAVPSRNADQDEDDQVGEDLAMYRDYFPDPSLQQYVQADMDAQLGADDEVASIEDAHDMAERQIDRAKELEQADAISNPKLGRASQRSGVNNADDASTGRLNRAAEQEKANEKPKRKPGRPPKIRKTGYVQSNDEGGPAPLRSAEPDSQTIVVANTTPRSEPKSSARAQRLLNEAGQRHASDSQSEMELAQQSQASTRARSKKSTSVSKTTAPSHRRSSRLEQNLADLNRRRNAPEVADPVGNDTAALADGDTVPSNEQHEDHEADEDEAELPERAVTLRPSEVLFDNDGDDADHVQDDEDEAQDAASSQEGRKRKASSQAAKANSSAKRRKRAAFDEEGYEEPEKEGSQERREVNQRRLWGQWLPLKRIHRDLRYVGCNSENGELLEQRKPKLKDNDVKAVVDLCEEAEKRYQRLANGEAEDSEPASLLEEIGERVDGLQGRNEDFPTDFEDKRKITNIYSHLIPALVKLTWQAAQCYESTDRTEVQTGRISMSHLQILCSLIQMTIDMEHAASSKSLYKARPDTRHAVVRPIHDYIAVPLRPVAQAFQQIIQRHRSDVQATQRRQREAQDRALRLEQDERRSRQTAALTRVRQKWEQLHRERMAVEGGLMRPEKMAHLRMPDPNRDVDSIGQVFDRVAVFHPRVGPPPGLIKRAKELVWTEGELRALMDGLRMYAGSMVYERLMRAWCPRGRILNRFNVIEIVAAAELLKAYFEGQAGEVEEVEEWVRAIPVWSKSHAAGEENEDSWVDDDNIDNGGDEAGAVAGPS